MAILEKEVCVSLATQSPLHPVGPSNQFIVALSVPQSWNVMVQLPLKAVAMSCRYSGCPAQVSQSKVLVPWTRRVWILANVVKVESASYLSMMRKGLRVSILQDMATAFKGNWTMTF